MLGCLGVGFGGVIAFLKADEKGLPFRTFVVTVAKTGSFLVPDIALRVVWTGVPRCRTTLRTARSCCTPLFRAFFTPFIADSDLRLQFHRVNPFQFKARKEMCGWTPP